MHDDTNTAQMPSETSASQPPAGPTPPTAARRLTYWNSLVLTVMIGSVVLLGAVEWSLYRREMEWSRLMVAAPLRLVLIWQLWCKSLVLALPGLALGGVAIWQGWRRCGYLLGLVWAGGIWTWLAIDARVVATSGRHALDYAEYFNAEQAIDWAGGWQMLLPIAQIVAAALAGTALLGVGLIMLSRHVERHHPRQVKWTPSWVLIVLIVGLPIAQRLIDDSSYRHFARLADAWPITVPMLDGGHDPRGNQEPFCVAFEQQLLPPYREVQPTLAEFTPPDDRKLFEPSKPLPNVILLILESLRHEVISPDLMKRLDHLADTGLRAKRHYACANNSIHGSYTLMHARAPFTFHHDLIYVDDVQPQMLLSLRQLGYDTTIVSSSTSNLAEWEMMGRFFSDKVFDTLIAAPSGDRNDWPRFDQNAMDNIQRIARQRDESDGSPQFVVGYLMSTHFDYRYPKDEEIHTPVIEGDGVMLRSDIPRRQMTEQLMNRYKNAAAYLDRIIAEMVDRIDLDNNIVIVTGDHGQSIWDDGYLAHDSVLSEIQTRVPLIMFGGGIEPTVINRRTGHMDILPTLLHALAGQHVEINNTHGDDLLAEPTGPDRVVCTRLDRRDRWHMLMIQDDHRFLATIDLASPAVRAVGFVDENMKPLNEVPQGQTPELWAGRFLEFLRNSR